MAERFFYCMLFVAYGVITLALSPLFQKKQLEKHPDIGIIRLIFPIIGLLLIVCGIIIFFR